MISARPVIVLAAAVALAAGPLESAAAAQTCDRQCSKDEGRDVYGCCVKRRKPTVDRPTTKPQSDKDPDARAAIIAPAPDPTTGSVLIDADDQSAIVYIDSIEVDDTLPTVVHRLTPGEHVVSVQTGDDTWKQKIEIKAGVQASVFAELETDDAPTMSEQEARGRKILDAALTAKGGEAALRALVALRYEGEALHTTKPKRWDFRHTVTAEPERSAIRLSSPSVDCRIVTTSASAWRSYPAGTLDGVEIASGDDVGVATGRLYAHPDLVLLRHREVGTIVTWEGSATVGDVDAHVVKVSRADGSGEAKLYISKADQHLAAVEQSGDTTVYTDYALIDVGPHQIQVALAWKIRLPVGEVEVEIHRVTPVNRIDEAVFAKPANPSLVEAGTAIVPLATGHEIFEELAMAAVEQGCLIDGMNRYGFTAQCKNKLVVVRQRDRELHAACSERSDKKCERLLTKLLTASEKDCDAACATARRDALPRTVAPVAHSGTIDLSADVRDARILVDGVEIYDPLPVLLSGLSPGAHAVEIRTKFSDWSESVAVEAGKTTAVFASVEGGKAPKLSKDEKRALELLQRAVKARGGEKAMSAAHTVMYSGVAKDPKLGSFEFQHVWVAAGMSYSRITSSQGAYREWVQRPDDAWHAERVGSMYSVYGGLPEASKGTGTKVTQYRAIARDELWRHPETLLLRYRESRTRLSVGPDKTIDGVVCHHLVMGQKGRELDWSIYLAKDDYRLIEIEGIGTFGDYRGDQLQLAHSWSDFKGMDVEIHDIQINPIIRDDLFERPIERWEWSQRSYAWQNTSEFELSSADPLGAELAGGARAAGCDVDSSARYGLTAFCGRYEIAIAQRDTKAWIFCNTPGRSRSCKNTLREVLLGAGFDELEDDEAKSAVGNAVAITWSTNAVVFRGKNQWTGLVSCPAGGTAGSVWGTGVYTDDSSICTAAVHAGVITIAAGGNVRLGVQAGEPSYQGSTKNGVTSASYGVWAGSLVIVSGQVGSPPK